MHVTSNKIKELQNLGPQSPALNSNYFELPSSIDSLGIYLQHSLKNERTVYYKQGFLIISVSIYKT